jgi:hypothetical protein
MPQLSRATTTKILAMLGSIALGFVAMINAVIAAVALFNGHLLRAIGDASEKANLDAHLTASASHAATTAKAIAIGYALLTALEFCAGEFLRRRIRNAIVPIACAATILCEVAFSVWNGKFVAFDAVLIGCAAFAAWSWWRLPRPEVEGAHDADMVVVSSSSCA